MIHLIEMICTPYAKIPLEDCDIQLAQVHVILIT